MLTQIAIRPETPMGGTLVDGGATFRVWAPAAVSVGLAGTFGGVTFAGDDAASALRRNADGTWTGFVPDAADGDVYRFFVVGAGSAGPKRDPYAREMATDASFPECGCRLRAATPYPWHDGAFRTPGFSDMVIYQLHVGTYLSGGHRYSTLLDVAGKVDYIAALGVNVLQPLPIVEVETPETMGYNGTDFFSPDLPFMVSEPARLPAHLARINALFAAQGLAPLQLRDLDGGYRQVKVLVDLCHAYGIAVVFDVVYNHAGGFDGDDHNLFFFDRAKAGDNDDSQYFIAGGTGAGGLAFALAKPEVRQFLIDNALSYLREFHADGFRYDEVSTIVGIHHDLGWRFCRDLTSTVRFVKPEALQNAEFWSVDADVVRPSGGGFDVTQHDGLRDTLRAAIHQASFGAQSPVDLHAVAAHLWPYAMDESWRAVTCIENHDIVILGKEKRIAALADGADARSWYARSRARFANGVLLTAPGIPMIFMGQEFLESKQWSEALENPNLIDWAGLDGGSKPMVDHLRFTQDLVRLRRRLAALRGPNLRVSLVDADDRVLVYHRWLDGAGRDVIVVASPCDHPFFGYAVGFPRAGLWTEVFNSDVYDDWVNPNVVGNAGAITVAGPPMHGFATSAALAIPANGFVVLAVEG